MEFILPVAVLIGLLPAFIAKSKGKSFMAWWIYGALLFIVALPHSVIMKADVKTIEAEAIADGGRKCPHCAEIVKVEAKVCRFCQRDLPAIPKIQEIGADWTPLHDQVATAVISGNVSKVKELLSKGVDVNTVNASNVSLMKMAINCSNKEISDLLSSTLVGNPTT